jgi:glucuronide carrier protein
MTTTTTATGGLSRLSVIGYGAGDAANNLAFMTSTMFLLVYYTDVAGISAAAAGTMFLVMRIFDAFTDLMAGRIIDRTSTRLGKFRPYILFGSFPLLILSAASFHVPQIGETGMLLYAYVTYALVGLAYTFVNIAYGSMAAAMTQEPTARAKLAAARTVGGAVVGAATGAVVSPLLSKDNDLQTVFTVMTLVFVVIGMALYLFTVFTTKETVERDVPKVSMKETVATLKGNKALMLLCLSSLLLLSAQLSKSTAQIYFMRDVFDALHLVPLLSIAQLALTFLVAPFVPAIVRRLGKRNAYIGAGLIAATGSLVAFFAPTVWVALGALVVSMPALLVVNMLIWALEADTVEYGEWKTGVRAEGITYALFSFTRKAGQAVGSALAAYALALGGYVGAATVQTASAELGIRAGTALIPAILTVGAALIMIVYPLTDKAHAEIVRQIKERREQTAHDADASVDVVP